jgi:hypothetical protein
VWNYSCTRLGSILISDWKFLLFCLKVFNLLVRFVTFGGLAA